jgi:hypothetical protein
MYPKISLQSLTVDISVRSSNSWNTIPPSTCPLSQRYSTISNSTQHWFLRIEINASQASNSAQNSEVDALRSSNRYGFEQRMVETDQEGELSGNYFLHYPRNFRIA